MSAELAQARALGREGIRAGQSGHPDDILMLTADAFGVLPPAARLSPEGASTICLPHSRAMIRAILARLPQRRRVREGRPVHLDVPRACPDVPVPVVNPRRTWSSEAEYDVHAATPAHMFMDNFRTFEGSVSAAVNAAGPRT